LRLQSEGAILKAATVLAFVAVRLSQLRDESDPEVLSERTKMVILSDFTHSENNHKKKMIEGLSVAKRPCTLILSPLEWKILWLKLEQGKPLPRKPPNRQWAYHAIGKLAGWYDSKRTGRVGMKTFWTGYCTLQDLTKTVTLVQRAEITV
jgi:hypothetical protein